MSKDTIKLLTYLDDQGNSPFNQWLLALKDIKARAIIRKRLNRIRLGLMGDFKSVGDGVYELRIFYGSGYRIYFAKEGNTRILLLCGGNKSSQKKDIIKAQNYLNDYRS